MGTIGYLKESVEKTQRAFKEYTLFDDIQVFIKDQFVEGVDLQAVLNEIERRLPSNLVRELDIIYIGVFPQLQARNVESAYLNGAIFVSNEMTDEDSLLKSFIHEIAHNVESVYGADIYADQKIKNEFLDKKEKLKSILEGYKFFCDPRLYQEIEYNKTFDDFLYKTVGYERLTILSSKIFISPYAATSLKEYFANGFEHYFTEENPSFLKNISPKLFSKITHLTKLES